MVSDFKLIKNKKELIFLIIIGIVCFIFIYFILSSILNYYFPVDDWEYCQRSKPPINESGTRAELCYTTYWAEYCKLTYPQYCPDKIKGVVFNEI